MSRGELAGGSESRGNDGHTGDIRGQLIAAICRVADERGYDGLSVDLICRYARVEPDVFWLHFETIDQALIAALDDFLARLWFEIDMACAVQADWAVAVREGLVALLHGLLEASTMARALAIASNSSLAASERRTVALEEFADRLREGREHHPSAASLPEATERVIVRGVFSVVSGHLVDEDPAVLRGLVPELTELVLTPYVGQDEARRLAGSI